LQLRKHGYTNCDGLDPSETLLRVGKKSGIFNKTYCCFVKPDEETPVESGKTMKI
jgi:hypothetical protein